MTSAEPMWALCLDIPHNRCGFRQLRDGTTMGDDDIIIATQEEVDRVQAMLHRSDAVQSWYVFEVEGQPDPDDADMIALTGRWRLTRVMGGAMPRTFEQQAIYQRYPHNIALQLFAVTPTH